MTSQLFVDCKVEHEKTDFSDVDSSLLQKVEQEPVSLPSIEDKSLTGSEVSTMTPDEADKLLSTRFVPFLSFSSFFLYMCETLPFAGKYTPQHLPCIKIRVTV